MADLIGQQLGQYRIISKLGQGGTALVYLARRLEDAPPNQNHYNPPDVAIKVLKDLWSSGTDYAKRFEREIHLISTLNHPHIVRLVEVVRESNITYLVMEYLSGGSLGHVIRRGPLLPEYARDILNQIADALDYAHQNNVIHRDMKPSNVLFDTNGVLKLTDFGLAKLVNSDGTNITAPNTALGTPWYMAPEQFQGANMTASTDVYGLGVMLFEMLAGRLPYDGETAERLMYQHINEKPIPLAGLGPHLTKDMQAVVEKAMAKKPHERFRSASEMAQAFSVLVGRHGSPPAPTRPKLNDMRSAMLDEPTAPLPDKAARNGAKPHIQPDGVTAKMPTPTPQRHTPSANPLKETYSGHIELMHQSEVRERHKQQRQVLFFAGVAVAMAVAMVVLLSILFP